MTDGLKSIFDVGSFVLVGATLVEWLPSVAALLSIVWTLVRLCETKTVRKWLLRR